MTDSVIPWTEPARLLCPWDSPGKNTRVYCHFLLHRIFLTQWWNPGLLLGRQILCHRTTWEALVRVNSDLFPRVFAKGNRIQKDPKGCTVDRVWLRLAHPPKRREHFLPAFWPSLRHLDGCNQASPNVGITSSGPQLSPAAYLLPVTHPTWTWLPLSSWVMITPTSILKVPTHSMN